MNSNPENRDKTRFEHQSTVTLETQKNGVQRGARLYNFSERGLYIEADHFLEPESEILVGITNSPYASKPNKYENYRGVIRWRKPLKRSVYNYGYGIELIEEKQSGQDDGDQYQGSRKHPRIEYVAPVKYESDSQTFEGTTENVSSGGVFIKTLNPIAVGQMVTIDLPLKKKGKIKRLTGKVTWSTRKGFGVKFMRNE